MTNATIIRTAQDALAAWDRGEALTVFEVETQGAPQEATWALALECLRDWPKGFKTVEPAWVQAIEERMALEQGAPALLPRECEVAREIATAANGHGWVKMLQIHSGLKPLPIQKPAGQKP